MAEEKPSYVSSTTSQILMLACVAYVLGSLLLLGIGAWQKDQALLSTGTAGLESLVAAVLPIYGFRKGAEMPKPGSPPAA